MSIEEAAQPTFALTKYHIADAEISALKEKFMPLEINGVNDTGGAKAVHNARIIIKNHRVDVEKRRKELKADSLKWGQRVDAEAKRITGLLDPIEQHLIGQEDAYEAEKERIKNAERLRLEAEARAKQEAEAARLKSEHDAEVARMKAEAEKIASERAALDAERARIEAQAQALADATAAHQREVDAEERRKAAVLQAERDRLAAIELVKQRQLEIEEAKAKAAERARIETESRIAREAEEAKQKTEREEATRIRLEELRPDKEKMLAFADKLDTLQIPRIFESAMEEVHKVISEASEKIRWLAQHYENKAKNDLPFE
jgi:Icc-related predicted phosphoesterase